MTFDIDKYEKAVGPMRACQLCLILFIEDNKNELSKKKYAETLYEWLGIVEITVEEMFEISYEKSDFILEVLKKYHLGWKDSNLLINYGDALDSLTYQKNILK
jgi:hypothetical protein